MDLGHEARPLLKRGMLAWAGGGGPHFFIALADHPEWGNDHIVSTYFSTFVSDSSCRILTLSLKIFGEVLPKDMPVASKIASLKSTASIQGTIQTLSLVSPVNFSVHFSPTPRSLDLRTQKSGITTGG
jgi:hypothetical protein